MTITKKQVYCHTAAYENVKLLTSWSLSFAMKIIYFVQISILLCFEMKIILFDVQSQILACCCPNMSFNLAIFWLRNQPIQPSYRLAYWLGSIMEWSQKIPNQILSRKIFELWHFVPDFLPSSRDIIENSIRPFSIGVFSNGLGKYPI